MKPWDIIGWLLVALLAVWIVSIPAAAAWWAVQKRRISRRAEEIRQEARLIDDRFVMPTPSRHAAPPPRRAGSTPPARPSR